MRPTCLEWILEHDLDAEIFGGLAPVERLRLARACGRPPEAKERTPRLA